MFLGDTNKQSDLLIPWCTYTEPEVAHVGKYEAELMASGVEFVSFVVSIPVPRPSGLPSPPVLRGAAFMCLSVRLFRINTFRGPPQQSNHGFEISAASFDSTPLIDVE